MAILQQEITTNWADTFPTKVLPEATQGRLLNIGVIGYGYWGPKLVRNFQEIASTRVSMISDLKLDRLVAVTKTYPDVKITPNYHDLLDSDVDAVVVATPISTHFAIARECLLHDKHVLIEKPLARSSAEVQELIDLANERKRVLMVGHTFEYNPAVELLKEIVSSGELGRIYYAYTARTNLGIFQKDVNVIWDLAPHDISILTYVLNVEPIDVSAVGAAYVQKGIHDVAHITVNFSQQIQAHIHVSWLDPCKVRRITIVGDSKMVVYDDVETLEKIKIYDTGVQVPEHTDNYGEFALSYRYGDISVPRVPLNEPLKIECSHFADCIKNGTRPRSDGFVGLKVVKVLESAQKSLLDGGTREPIAR